LSSLKEESIGGNTVLIVEMAWWMSASAPHTTAEIPTLWNILPTICTRSSKEGFVVVSLMSIRTLESVGQIVVDIVEMRGRERIT
jgi:hypothetical protein